MEGTEVATEEGGVEIQDIELGQRVLPDSPECRAMDLSGWQQIELEMFDEAGQRPENGFEMSILRPAEWLGERGVGDVVSVAMDEMGFRGFGRILSVTAGPEVEPGPGCPVTARFRRVADNVMTLRLVGQAEPIEVTENHPFFSATRGTWVRAGELRAGEALLAGADGGGVEVVAAVTAGDVRGERVREVFNVEVAGSHVYLVGDAAVLVHNDCFDQPQTCIDPARLLHEELSAMGENAQRIYDETVLDFRTTMAEVERFMNAVDWSRWSSESQVTLVATAGSEGAAVLGQEEGRGFYLSMGFSEGSEVGLELGWLGYKNLTDSTELGVAGLQRGVAISLDGPSALAGPGFGLQVAGGTLGVGFEAGVSRSYDSGTERLVGFPTFSGTIDTGVQVQVMGGFELYSSDGYYTPIFSTNPKTPGAFNILIGWP